MHMAPKEENTSISGCHTALAPKFNIDILPQHAIFQKNDIFAKTPSLVSMLNF